MRKLTLEEREARLARNRAKLAGGEVTHEIHTTRPTATRTLAGGLMLGPIGAIAGFAWRKKHKVRVIKK